MTLTDMLKELPQYGEKLGLKMEWRDWPTFQYLQIWNSDSDWEEDIDPDCSEIENAPGKEMLREALVRLSQCGGSMAVRACEELWDNNWENYTTENVVKAVYEVVR